MPNTLDVNGLTIKQLSEITAELNAALRDIYGDDINLDSNSPDGQFVGINAQAMADVLELLMNIYNSFDPDQAVGTTLDQRVAINGLQRLAGSYTYVYIDIVVDRSLTLKGLDLYAPEDCYTVADAQGNQFYLAQTINPQAEGTYTVSFRAQNIGLVEVLPNTINVPVTIVLGVNSVNNPSAATIIGSNEETDAALRTRRQRSFALASNGYFFSLVSALLGIEDVTFAKVYENVDDVSNPDGVPPHSIWVIVEGGTNEDIANAIYANRTAGCGMWGAVSYDIMQIDGSVFTVNFDRTTTQDIYIRLTVSAITGSVGADFIKNQLVQLLTPDVYEAVDSTEITALVKKIQPNVIVSNSQVSTNGSTWANLVTPQDKKTRFLVSADNITVTVV